MILVIDLALYHDCLKGFVSTVRPLGAGTSPLGLCSGPPRQQKRRRVFVPTPLKAKHTPISCLLKLYRFNRTGWAQVSCYVGDMLSYIGAGRGEVMLSTSCPICFCCLLATFYTMQEDCTRNFYGFESGVFMSL